MTQAPPADVTVTPALVRALLAEQHPDLADLPLEVTAHGWDNVVLRLGEDLAVRVPRRSEAARLVGHELRALPVLAPRLPVPVPVAVRAGRPSSALGYPWTWAVVPWTEGTLVADVPRAARRPLARQLADVLVALHEPAPADAPRNDVRGVALATRDTAVRERLARLAAPDGYLATSGLDAASGQRHLLRTLTAVWEEGIAAPPHAGPPLWLHGDLHAANLLATPTTPHALASVVDWGDVTSGDPATDLAVSWLVLDAPGRASFDERLRQAGHPSVVDAGAAARARAWALTVATAMAEHAAPGTPHHALATGVLAELCDLVAPRAAR